MKLLTSDEQVSFLMECYKQIKRLRDDNGDEEEGLLHLFVKEYTDIKSFPSQELLISRYITEELLPEQLGFIINCKSSRVSKIQFFIYVYNTVANDVKNGEKTDLNLIKSYVEELRKKSNDLSISEADIEKSITEHRNPSKRNPTNIFMKFIAWLFPPKSKIFCSQYGLFETKATSGLHQDNQVESRSVDQGKPCFFLMKM